MSDVFSAMNDVPNHENTTESQGRKAVGMDFVSHIGNESSMTGFQSSYSLNAVQSNSDTSMGYSQQSLYNSQVPNYSSGVDYSQSGIRLDVSSNGVLDHELRQSIPSNYQQHPYTQAHVAMNLNNTGSVLNGNYSTLKHIHPHNMSSSEAFLSAPQQPLVHQYGSSAIQPNPTIHPNNTQPHNQVSGGHVVSLSNDQQMISRSGAPTLPNSNISVHALPADNGSSGSISNPYLSMNRNVGMITQHHIHPNQHPTQPQTYQIGGQQSVHYSNQNGNFQITSGASSRSNVAKPWHSSDHSQLREGVAEEIVKILKSRKPNAGDGWHDKLPHMAKRLEDALYQEALTYDEYADRNTLKHRLQQLALTMGSKNQSKPSSITQNPTIPANGNTAIPASQQPQVVRQAQGHPNYSLPYLQNVQQPSHMHLPQHTAQVPSQYPNYQTSQGSRGQLPSQYTQMSSLHGSIPINASNGYQANADYSSSLPQNGLRPVNQMVNSQNYLPLDHANNGDSYSRGFSTVPAAQQVSGQQNAMFKEESNHYPGSRAPALLSSGTHPNVNIGGHSNPGNSINNQNSDEHRKQVLKQQQQRLLLLRHASKCPHESGRCPVTPHCWNMKQLWKHIMSCKDQDCKVAHCVSSRYVLSHYSKCKEPTCPVCGPVREAIKRNYERSRDVVKMARNPSLGPPPSGTAHQLGMPTFANSLAPPISKGDEPEKKKIRRKSDVPPAAIGTGGSQVSQPLVIRQPPRKIYPLDPISSAIYSFTNEQIQSHFRTIHEGLRLTVGKIKEMCKPLLEEIFRIPHAQGVFGSPVDPVALGLADYFDVVKAPMDLGTVMKKLDGGSYRDLPNFVADIHLTFDNAMLYNPKNTDVYLLASNLKKEFDRKYRLKIVEFEKQIEENRKNKDACLVCGEVALKYEPPVYYCNGTCAQRIRRNAVFYSNNSNTYHWCSLCFNAMKENDVIRLPDCTITKAELAANKKKHIEESGEGWVECEGGCKRWVHQICSLFNNRRNVSDDVSYVCPLCLQEKRRKSPNEEIVAQTSKKMKAADLPVTTLSDFLEKRIMKRLEIAYEDTAQRFGLDLASVERCPTLTLRQVSCVDKLQPVRDGFYHRYKDKGYPTDFPCRSKCLVLFQNIDGQDVILFGMYVYEYGHKCPQPNQRRVYISYLDSVHYLRPKQYRTLVYHEILISYLDYMKSRGFHTVHIWACPPQKGDDYILYVHPQDQKTPKPQILRLWYDEMLKRCMERGIVCEMTDLHTEYLLDPNIEATTLPYFEGDYWVNEAEVIIKNLTDGRKDDDVVDELSGSKSKRRSKTKRPGKVASTSLGASKSERDPLMAKLAAIIEPMKDTFFVARLHPKEFADKFLAVSSEETLAEDTNKEKSDRELQEEALSGQDIVPQLPEIQTNQVSVKGTKRAREDDEISQRDVSPEEDDSEDDFLKNATFITANADSNSVGRDTAGEERERLSSTPSIDGKTEDNDVPLASSSSALPETTIGATLVEQDCLEAKEPAVAPEVKRVEISGLIGRKTIACGEDMPTLPDDTEDVDDIQESEHFDTRQSFLNLCQGNHYQFDQLRRAKHSSMMVLYHLHNPDAPKFVPSCGNCHLDILTGTRYRCEKCELDYCQSCFSRVGNSIHNHPLRPINGSNTAPTKLTEEQRRERQRSIQLHMQLLNHAANCVKCESRNCAKMKDFLLHESQCKIKSAGGCRLCSRISNLLNIHARSCRIDNCKVPQCLKLREQFRQLALSQQRMDDRRRKKMNSEYNRGTTESRLEDEEN